MELAVVGLNHRRAPVALRERLAIQDAELPATLAALRGAVGSAEEVVLSTCNRVELYVARDEAGAPLLPAAAAVLSARRGVPAAEIEPLLYVHSGPDAVRHLFRVASSLDSMVLGETQIIAQVKEAYQAARQAGHTGRVFNQLFQRALHAAKQVHASTSIGEKNLSVPTVAANLARKVFQDLSSKRALILGAGETGTLTLQAFRDRGIGGVIVVNRTLETAQQLVAKTGGEAHALDRLDEVLPRADIVIACLSAPDFVLTPERIAAALQVRRGAPMFLIDISVPRNINPGVNRLDNVYLFDIDALDGLVNQNLAEREREMAVAEPIVERESVAALKDVELVDVERVLVRLRQSYHEVGEEELKRTIDKLGPLSEAQREEVAQLVRRILNKVLHAPTTTLKEEAHDGRGPGLLELAMKLFGIKK